MVLSMHAPFSVAGCAPVSWNRNCCVPNRTMQRDLAMIREEIYFTVVVISIVLVIDLVAIFIYFRCRP